VCFVPLMMSLHVCNLRSWHTCDTHLVCSLKSGCDRSGTKAMLTIGSHSLVRNGHLSCPFGLLSSLRPLLSYFICLSHLLSYLAFNTYSTFIIFHYYLISAFIISPSLSPLSYIYYLLSHLTTNITKSIIPSCYLLFLVHH
jgi:hypothetical protein